ncbi:YHYH domain-containing protein [Aminobacter anthyllidis]|nr:YHYH domain-containing protein [Aminobacter anthyllidis]MDH4989087.1 YHYH domain-containing protein [Aminobacter anthyllidis]
MKYALIAIYLISSAAGITAAVAHGGGTDANGCHNDRKNGGYHCH